MARLAVYASLCAGAVAGSRSPAGTILMQTHTRHGRVVAEPPQEPAEVESVIDAGGALEAIPADTSALGGADDAGFLRWLRSYFGGHFGAPPGAEDKGTPPADEASSTSGAGGDAAGPAGGESLGDGPAGEPAAGGAAEAGGIGAGSPPAPDGNTDQADDSPTSGNASALDDSIIVGEVGNFSDAPQDGAPVTTTAEYGAPVKGSGGAANGSLTGLHGGDSASTTSSPNASVNTEGTEPGLNVADNMSADGGAENISMDSNGSGQANGGSGFVNAAPSPTDANAAGVNDSELEGSAGRDVSEQVGWEDAQSALANLSGPAHDGATKGLGAAGNETSEGSRDSDAPAACGALPVGTAAQDAAAWAQTVPWASPEPRVQEPHAPCLFGLDERDEGYHCILDNGKFGSFGWCYTSEDRSDWGSCNKHCPLFGSAQVLGEKIDKLADRLLAASHTN